jgi:hypothetical protein
MAVFVSPLFLQHIEFGYPLAKIGQRNRSYRTSRCTSTAQGAAILPVFDDPGKIVVT